MYGCVRVLVGRESSAFLSFFFFFCFVRAHTTSPIGVGQRQCRKLMQVCLFNLVSSG